MVALADPLDFLLVSTCVSPLEPFKSSSTSSSPSSLRASSFEPEAGALGQVGIEEGGRSCCSKAPPREQRVPGVRTQLQQLRSRFRNFRSE